MSDEMMTDRELLDLGPMGELVDRLVQARIALAKGDEGAVQAAIAARLAIDRGWPRQGTKGTIDHDGPLHVRLAPASPPMLTVPDDVHTSDSINMVLDLNSGTTERMTGLIMDLLRSRSRGSEAMTRAPMITDERLRELSLNYGFYSDAKSHTICELVRALRDAQAENARLRAAMTMVENACQVLREMDARAALSRDAGREG